MLSNIGMQYSIYKFNVIERSKTFIDLDFFIA